MLCSRCTLLREPQFIKSHGKFPDTLFSAPFDPTAPPGRVCCLERAKFLFCLCQCFRGSRRSNLPFGHRNRPSLWYGHCARVGTGGGKQPSNFSEVTTLDNPWHDRGSSADDTWSRS